MKSAEEGKPRAAAAPCAPRPARSAGSPCLQGALGGRRVCAPAGQRWAEAAEAVSPWCFPKQP